MALIRYPNFTGGSFTTQNPLASHERTVNLCPDVIAAPGAANHLVLDPTPGFKPLAITPTLPHRGMYEHNGRVYLVAGNTFYELRGDFGIVTRGILAVDAHPATMHANGEAAKEIFITSADHGYIFNTETHAFTEVLSSGAAVGNMLDGFFLTMNRVDSSFRCSALLDGLSWPGINTAFRSAAPDPWRAFAVCDKLIALMGDKTTEFWYNAGASPFPFEPVPNALIPFGVQAVDSPQAIGGALFWLARTEDDINEVVMVTGTNPKIISTPALHWALKRYARTDDAIGFAQSYLGHLFYGLCFPSASATWVYDMTTSLWHEEGTWLPDQMRYDALRPIFHCVGFGLHLVGDRLTGQIYERHVLYPTDVDGLPLRRVRRPPQLFGNGRWLSFGTFELVLETGLAPDLVPPVTPASRPQVELFRSNDSGKTWWSAGFRDAGTQGEFSYRPTWNRLGGTDQFAGFEIVMSSPVPWRIVDALIEVNG